MLESSYKEQSLLLQTVGVALVHVSKRPPLDMDTHTHTHTHNDTQ